MGSGMGFICKDHSGHHVENRLEGRKVEFGSSAGSLGGTARPAPGQQWEDWYGGSGVTWVLKAKSSGLHCQTIEGSRRGLPGFWPERLGWSVQEPQWERWQQE